MKSWFIFSSGLNNCGVVWVVIDVVGKIDIQNADSFQLNVWSEKSILLIYLLMGICGAVWSQWCRYYVHLWTLSHHSEIDPFFIIYYKCKNNFLFLSPGRVISYILQTKLALVQQFSYFFCFFIVVSFRFLSRIQYFPH